MQEVKKQIFIDKVKPPNVIFLKVWQGLELFFIIAAFAELFIMYAFSCSKGMGIALSILWKVFFLKIVVMIFFFKKKRWAVIFNIIQNSAIIMFLIYAVFYTIFRGDTNHLPAMLGLVAIILLFGVFYFFIIKKYFQYFEYLKRNINN